MAAFVTDSTTPIAFARTRRLDVLRRVCGRLIVSPGVHYELGVRGGSRPGAQELRTAFQPGAGQWIEVRQLFDPNYPRQLQGVYPLLQVADAETVALAFDITPDYLIMDEERGWEAAHDVCGGTTTKIISLHWILDEAEVRGIIPSASALYKQMIDGSAYATAKLPIATYQRYRQAGGRGLP